VNDYPHPLPEVEETSRTSASKHREVSLQNAYEGDHGGISHYDQEQYCLWQEERTDENKAGLPWEITSDDKRAEIRWNEAETRHLAAELPKIVASWDERDAKRK
jgi:hypothetical protein